MSKTTSKKINLRNGLNVAGNGWIWGSVDGLEVQAKVYDEPSQYGMELDGRISKLWVRSPGFGILYNYDRGLDTDLLDAETLAMIVDAVTAVK